MFKKLLVFVFVLSITGCSAYNDFVQVDKHGRPFDHPVTIRCYKCGNPADWDREKCDGTYTCPVCKSTSRYVP